jgi:hypothetical protein
VKQGLNSLEISVSPMNIFAELQPVYLRGDFSLESKDKGWKLVPFSGLSLGSWKEQGMPCYADKVSYVKHYDLSGLSAKRYKVRLGEWKGTVAEVRINGEGVGIIGWQPYELEVTDALQPGRNKVEVVVVGSLKNLLGPLHTPWQRGIVTIGDFQQGPEIQPEGVRYDTFDYGLMNDFELVSF